MKTPQTARLLRPDEVAERLSLHKRTVLRDPLRSRLPWLVLGPRVIRLERDALESFLDDTSAA